MSLQELKALMGLSGDKHDPYLSTVLPLLIEFAQEHCHQSFTDEQGNLQLPGGVKVALAKLAEYQMQQNTVQSESLGDHSVSYGVDVPAAITAMLKPYRRVRFV